MKEINCHISIHYFSFPILYSPYTYLHSLFSNKASIRIYTLLRVRKYELLAPMPVLLTNSPPLCPVIRQEVQVTFGHPSVSQKKGVHKGLFSRQEKWPGREWVCYRIRVRKVCLYIST